MYVPFKRVIFITKSHQLLAIINETIPHTVTKPSKGILTHRDTHDTVPHISPKQSCTIYLLPAGTVLLSSSSTKQTRKLQNRYTITNLIDFQIIPAYSDHEFKAKVSQEHYQHNHEEEYNANSLPE